MFLKTAGWVTNSVDTDQMPHSAASDLVLHCFAQPSVSQYFGLWGYFGHDKWKGVFEDMQTVQIQIILHSCTVLSEHLLLINSFLASGDVICW